MKHKSTPARRLSATAAILTACLLFSACGSSGSSDTGSSEGGGLTSITIATEQLVLSLDGVETNSLEINQTIYDGLTRQDDKAAVIPGLATKWESNADASQWTFTMRTGATFSDGTPVTAADVVGTYNAINASPTSKAKTNPANVKKVEASADGTQVVFTLIKPSAIWPLLTASTPIVSIAARDKMGPEQFAKTPVGSGPYVVKSTNSNDEVVLTANAHYWDGAPAIKTVTYKTVADQTTRLNGLQSGEYDIALLSGSNVDTAKGAGLKVVTKPSAKTIYVGFNLTAPGLDDPKLREAFSYAIDREALAKTVLSGKAAPINQLTSPTTFGYDKSIAVPKVDLAKAKQLVSESSYAGQEITLEVPDGGFVPATDQVGQAVAEYLGQAGIKVKLKTTSQATFLTDWLGAKLQSAFIFSMQSSTLDGQGSYSLTTGVASYFKDPEITGLYDQQSAELDPAKRAALLSDIAKTINAKAYYVPLFYDTFNFVYNKDLKLDAPAMGYLQPRWMS